MENEKKPIKNKSERINYAQMTPEQRDKFWSNYRKLSEVIENIDPDEQKGT